MGNRFWDDQITQTHLCLSMISKKSIWIRVCIGIGVARGKDASGVFIVQALGPYPTVCNAPFMLVTFTKLLLSVVDPSPS